MQIVDLVWGHEITVRLVLAKCDVSSLEGPPVLYFHISRQSYLHTLVPLALPLLHHLLPPGEHTTWFDYNSLPLKWHVPVGVLYDLLVPQHDIDPWPLTLHFRNYPSATLTACGGEAALRGSLLNSLKEAAFICCGTAQRVQGISTGAQEELWRAVVAADESRYRTVLMSLQMEPRARNGGQGQKIPFIPVRLYIRTDGGFLSSYEGIHYTSRPLPARCADGGATTLGDAVLPLVAACLAEGGGANPRDRQQPPDAAGSASSSSAGAETDASGVGNAQQQQVEALEARLAHVYVEGISLEAHLEAPLAALHWDLHCPDYFLYIVVHLRSHGKK